MPNTACYTYSKLYTLVGCLQWLYRTLAIIRLSRMRCLAGHLLLFNPKRRKVVTATVLDRCVPLRTTCSCHKSIDQLTTDCLSYCMTNCTGWIYRSESTTSSARLFTAVCSARLRHTWRISAHRSPISPVGSIYVRLAATSSSFHATVARSSAVGPSLLRVRWPGTHCRTASEIRLCQPALSDLI